MVLKAVVNNRGEENVSITLYDGKRAAGSIILRAGSFEQLEESADRIISNGDTVTLEVRVTAIAGGVDAVSGRTARAAPDHGEGEPL